MAGTPTVRASALACGIAPTQFSRRLCRHRVRHPGAGIRTTPVTSAPATAPTPAHLPMHVCGHGRREMPAATRTPMTWFVPEIVCTGSPAARTRSRAAPTTRPSSRCARLHRDPAATIARSGPAAARANAPPPVSRRRQSVFGPDDIAFGSPDTSAAASHPLRSRVKLSVPRPVCSVFCVFSRIARALREGHAASVKRPGMIAEAPNPGPRIARAMRVYAPENHVYALENRDKR